eukprot:scaffold7703_cov103-Isochrysis_galbana.AAC.3
MAGASGGRKPSEEWAGGAVAWLRSCGAEERCESAAMGVNVVVGGELGVGSGCEAEVLPSRAAPPHTGPRAGVHALAPPEVLW